MRLINLVGLGAFALVMGCGRPSSDVDVKMVGVGLDPEEVGPSPTPYGGVVELDYVEFSGGNLPLALMGLGSYNVAGPELTSFEPPYAGIFGFSYIFDQKLPAADTMMNVGAAPPDVEDSCYTAFEPSGPIGSFTTVDVGDYMEFFSTNPDHGFKMNRLPGDYPPDPQDMFIYYIGFQFHTPEPMKHLVPDPADPDNPYAMTQETYRQANFPFEEELSFRFPGGFSDYVQPVASIPRPSQSMGENLVRLPSAHGGVVLDWDGPRFGPDGDTLAEDGPQRRCFEYYGERDEDPSVPGDCDELFEAPTDIEEYNSFPGQIYTAPWDTTDGNVTFAWTPREYGDQVTLTVRFLEKVDLTDSDFLYPAVKMDNGSYRPAQTCEEADASWEVKGNYVANSGGLVGGLQGDPSSKMAEITCLLKDDGEFVLSEDVFANALSYVKQRGAGGVVFFFGRGNEEAINVPFAKDQYDQKHDISPVKVSTRAIRIGRFHWEQ